MYRKKEGDEQEESAPLLWIGCDFCDNWMHYECEMKHCPQVSQS